jgi:hypothetical protein
MDMDLIDYSLTTVFISLDMREIRLEVVPKPEPGTAATLYEKSEQLGDQPYLIGDGEERNENRRFFMYYLLFSWPLCIVLLPLLHLLQLHDTICCHIHFYKVIFRSIILLM